MKKGLITIVAILIASLIGFHFYKVHSVKSAIRILAIEDNLLIEKAAEDEGKWPLGSDETSDWKLEKHIIDREETIRKVEQLQPYTLKKEIAMYIELLKAENEYVRELRAIIRKAENSKLELDKMKDLVSSLNPSLYTTRSYMNFLMRVDSHSRTITIDMLQATESYLQAANKLLALEKKYAKSLASILPKRDIVHGIEKAIKRREESAEKIRKIG